MLSSIASSTRKGVQSSLSRTHKSTTLSTISKSNATPPPHYFKNKIRRFFFSSSSSSSSKHSKNWKQNGTPEIMVGVTILSLLFVDSLIQRYNEDQYSLSRKTIIHELDKAIQEDERLLKQNNNTITASSVNNEDIPSSSTNGRGKESMTTLHPLIDINGKECTTLYKCQIMKLPKYFDGTKSLKNVQLNDVVQVIQEFVGPDSTYHLCRIEKKISDKDDDNDNQKGQTYEKMIEYLEARYEYGWFPITCLKKL